MKKSVIVRYYLTLFLLISPAFAQHMNEKDSPCAAVVGTSDLVHCLSKARTAADVNLNTYYRRVLSTLRTRVDDAERLRHAERLWVEYRDASCAAEGALYGGGTGGPPAYLACMDEMTRARTKELQVTYGWLIEKFGPSEH